MCPNWCCGDVTVSGKPKDIENFCELFLFEEDNENKKKYFARSFIHQSWKNFKEEYLGESEAEFSVDFAWSCWSCIFEGYPQDNPINCVTLEWAMKKYNVKVEIDTEEGGMGFEEKITTENGKPICICVDMPEYTCQKCWNKQLIPSKYDLSNEECMECGTCGEWEDELQKIMIEKLNKIKEKKDGKNRKRTDN